MIEDSFEKRDDGFEFSKEALRSLLVLFSDWGEYYDGNEVDKLINENPEMYKYYKETLRPMIDEFIYNDDPLDAYPELTRVFKEISLISQIEKEWVFTHASDYLKSQLSTTTEEYYRTLVKNNNLESNDDYNDFIKMTHADIENEEIVEKNPDIMEENIYKFLTDSLSKTEWQNYVDSFLDDPAKLKILKYMEKRFGSFKQYADTVARFVTNQEPGSEDYNRRYELSLRKLIKMEHIEMIKSHNTE